ncbi:hypothetical protein [Streptomyces sp. NPDC007070]
MRFPGLGGEPLTGGRDGRTVEHRFLAEAEAGGFGEFGESWKV